MRDFVFYLVAEFGEGGVIAVGLEDGVVAETARSPALLGDGAVDGAVEIVLFRLAVLQ